MLENHLVVFSEELAKKISVYFNFINATQQRKVYKDLCDKWSKEYIAETHKWVVLVHIVFLAYTTLYYTIIHTILCTTKSECKSLCGLWCCDLMDTHLWWIKNAL